MYENNNEKLEFYILDLIQYVKYNGFNEPYFDEFDSNNKKNGILPQKLIDNLINLNQYNNYNEFENNSNTIFKILLTIRELAKDELYKKFNTSENLQNLTNLIEKISEAELSLQEIKNNKEYLKFYLNNKNNIDFLSIKFQNVFDISLINIIAEELYNGSKPFNKLNNKELIECYDKTKDFYEFLNNNINILGLQSQKENLKECLDILGDCSIRNQFLRSVSRYNPGDYLDNTNTIPNISNTLNNNYLHKPNDNYSRL